MIWIAPSEKDTDKAALEKRLWDAADQAVPASHPAKTEDNVPRLDGFLDLIFLRFAEVRFAAQLGYSRKIQNLRRTRDLLLPRLLSGQVELAEKEQFHPNGAFHHTVKHAKGLK
jgi:hypothetical protein